MKKPSKPKLTVTQGKTPGEDMKGSASKGPSPLMMLGGKKNYKKQQPEPGADMGSEPGFGMTGMSGES